MKILIVEDQVRLAEFLKRGLVEQAHTVMCAATCQEARDALCESNVDAIVLDLSLPDGDGLDLLHEWRQNGFTEPVVILSARDTVQDRIKGLDVGADDYLPKPFSLEELLARVRSLLRRHSAVKKTVLEHEHIKLDMLGHQAFVDGTPVDLTSREYALLEVFMQNPGRILTRSQLCEKVWESNFDVDTNLLDVYMSKLRAKLEPTSSAQVFRTVRGVGYKLV